MRKKDHGGVSTPNRGAVATPKRPERDILGLRLKSGHVLAPIRVFALLYVGLLGLLQLSASPASAAESAPCPNEALRSTLNSTLLPDCRAYELVSPVYKEGYPVFLGSGASAYAADGESLIVTSIGTFAGNPGSSESLTESGQYLIKRTSVGWRLIPMNPPASEFIGQIPRMAEATDGGSLWQQFVPGQSSYTRDLYLRSASGTFQRIGSLSPLVPPVEENNNVIFSGASSVAQPRAATHDFSHVILEAEYAQARWPFDETAGGEAHSLYEYSGVGNGEPILVGVTGGKGSRQLIAQCGTRLGSGIQGTIYNGLSSDGETVFFTVEACSPGHPRKELYARLHGALTSPTPAETIQLSASECAEECGSEESGKNFEGASEGGGKAFFTSTQKLTNDAVDGVASGDAAQKEGCGHMKAGNGGCNLYEYDFQRAAGERLKAISVGGEVMGVMGVGENGSHVYYVSRAAIGVAGENVFHQTPSEGQPNLYAYDSMSGKTAFVATLSSGDEEDWIREGKRTSEVVGPEGRTLLFVSSTPKLTPDDRSTPDQLFEYQAEGVDESGPELIRVSKGENGFNEDGNGASVGVDPSSISNFITQYNSKYDIKAQTDKWKASFDGKTVFFVTPGQLSPNATSADDGCTSLYEFHTDGALSEGGVHLISDGRDTQLYKGDTCGARFEATDATGANVLFTSADPLVPGDTDGEQVDIYDARVDGGFAPVVGGGCGAESCEARSSGPALPPAASSVSQTVEAPAIAAAGEGHSGKPAGSRKSRRKKAHKRHRPARKRSRGARVAPRARSAKGVR